MDLPIDEHIKQLRTAHRKQSKVKAALDAIVALDCNTAFVALQVACGQFDEVTEVELSLPVRNLAPLAKLKHLESIDVRFSDPRSSWPAKRYSEESTLVDLTAVLTLPKLKSLSIIAEAVDATPLMLLEHLEALEFSQDPDSNRARVRPSPPRNKMVGRAHVLGYQRKIARELAKKEERSEQENQWLERAGTIGLLERAAAPKLNPKARKALTGIRKMMKSTNPEQLAQMHELMLSLGKSAVISVLAEGCSVDDQGQIITGAEVHRRAKSALRPWVTLAVLHAAGALTDLQQLDLDQIPMVNLSPFTGMTSLQFLSLNQCGIYDPEQYSKKRPFEIADLQPITALSHLKALEMDWAITEETAALLNLPRTSARPVRGAGAAQMLGSHYRRSISFCRFSYDVAQGDPWHIQSLLQKLAAP